MQSIGNQDVFPVAYNGDVAYAQRGINYRRWLIGQALAGAAADSELGHNSCMLAEWCIGAADAIIAKLDAEQQQAQP